MSAWQGVSVCPLLTKGGDQRVGWVELGQADHGVLQGLHANFRVEESATGCLLERIAASYVPPTVSVCIFLTEVREGDDGILVGLLRFAERSAFQIAVLDVDVIVKIRVLLRGDNRE